MVDVFGEGRRMLDGSECAMEFEVEADLDHKERGMQVKRIK
jgi:hypothetical protein